MRKKNRNGEGSKPYRRKDGRWVARLPGSDRKAVYGKTWEECHNKWIKAMASRGEVAFNPGKLTVGQYLERWLEVSAKSSVGQNIFDRYVGCTRNDIVPDVGNIHLSKLKPAHVEGLKASLVKRLAPATVRYVLGVLSTAMSTAVDWELVKSNLGSL
jgi:integrase